MWIFMYGNENAEFVAKTNVVTDANALTTFPQDGHSLTLECGKVSFFRTKLQWNYWTGESCSVTESNERLCDFRITIGDARRLSLKKATETLFLKTCGWKKNFVAAKITYNFEWDPMTYTSIFCILFKSNCH